MKNKEPLKTSMDRRLSFLDERPSCRPALMQRIAREEAPVMKMNKKMIVGLVFALVLVSLSIIGVATGLLLSPRVSAAQLAERELENKYGITRDMQSLFYRQEEELPDGTVRVTYTGSADLDYVLGTYTVDVKDGKAAVSWTHDGEEVSGGYESEAWGPEQLAMIIAAGTDEKETKAYLAKAESIRKKYVTDEEPEPSAEPEEPFEDWYARREAEKNSALNARKIPEEEMTATALEFIVSSNGLTESEVARLERYGASGESPENEWYDMVAGKPCFLVEYLLDEEDYDPVAAETDENYIWNNRYFKVYVNVETGVIEQYEFSNGIGGVG